MTFYHDLHRMHWVNVEHATERLVRQQPCLVLRQARSRTAAGTTSATAADPAARRTASVSAATRWRTLSARWHSESRELRAAARGTDEKSSGMRLL